MGLFDSIKNILNVPDEDEYEDDTVDTEEEEAPKKKESEERTAPRRSEPSARIIKSRNAPAAQSLQMQMVLVRPDRFEDVTSIADHLNQKKAVVLNLEASNRELSRRITDFLSGVAYANNGNMRKVANNTFLIVPYGVDVMGELMLEEFDESKLYF